MGTSPSTRLSALAPLLLALLSLVRPASAQPLRPDEVPAPLRAYVPWVLRELPTYGCTRDGDTMVCAFPGRVTLTPEGTDVLFALDVVLDRRRPVSLPGASDAWPTAVREGTRALVVVPGERGEPVVELDAGSHRVEGRLRYGRRPESVPVPPEVARVVVVGEGGARRTLPPRTDGVVPLHGTGGIEGSVDEADTATLEVVRRIEDGVPLVLDTQILLRIGGRARALALGRVLVPGSTPSQLDSTLPVQIGEGDSLTVQAVSGTHRIRIRALVADPRAELRAPRLPSPWPAQEIWLFAPSELHRQVDVRGAPSIDPQTPSIPEDWRSAAAFALSQGAALVLGEQRRGEPTPPPNVLDVQRTLWLDFDGHGFSAVDRISGEWNRGGRLDLHRGDLGHVTIGGGPGQLITNAPSGGGRGLELRQSQLDLEAELRIEQPATDLPALGWSEDAHSLGIELNLPPGYTLLFARGADTATDAWVSRWDVGPVFLVLLVAVIFGRLFDRRTFALALATLVLTYGEDGAPVYAFLAVLVPLAIVRTFRAGRFAQFVYLALGAATVALAVMSADFVATQLRYALHPQLVTEDRVGGGGYDFGVAREALAPAAPSDMEGGSGAPAAEADARGNVFEAPSSGSYATRRAQDALENWIDPNAVVQAGHGKVDWRHTVLSLGFSGPVTKDHRLSLVLVPPSAQRLLALLRALGLLGLLVILARARPPFPPRAKPADDAPASGVSEPTKPDAPQAASRTAAAALVAIATTLAALLGAERAEAQPASPADAVTGAQAGAQAASSPVPADAPTLRALADALTAPPSCGVRCVTVADLALETTGETLRIVLEIHAAATAAVALPGPATSFVPDTVTLDGQPTEALRAGADGHLHLRVPAGVHRVELLADIRGRATLGISLPTPPGHASARAEGFAISGIDENGRIQGSIELRRALGATSSSADARGSGADVPVWVRVERHLDVGIQWLVTTTVRRLSATSAPAVVRIPALAGETVLGNQATRDGDELVLTLPQGVPELRFESHVRADPRLALAVPREARSATGVGVTFDVSYACSPLYHCEHEGVPALQLVRDGQHRPTFAPYPGEAVTLRASRLGAAPGRASAIDGVVLHLSPGVRTRNGTLRLEVRSSVSHTLQLGLPEDVVLERVEVDGLRRAADVRDGRLAIGLVPENREVLVTFVQNHPLGFVTATPRFTFGAPAVDVRVELEVPSERWLLLASGPSWGPVIRFWGHLLLVLVIALGLARVPGSPLRLPQWALLVLGLTQIPLPFTFVVAGWFFLVQLQHQRKLSGALFNLTQLVAVAYTLVAAGVLVSAVFVGLNQRPDMHVVGNGSYESQLNFTLDRAEGGMPIASFVSVSVWVWKGLMLLWAFWLAASVVRWAIWAIGPFRELGFFAKTPPPPPVVPPARPAVEATPAPTPASAPTPPPEPAPSDQSTKEAVRDEGEAQ